MWLNQRVINDQWCLKWDKLPNSFKSTNCTRNFLGQYINVLWPRKSFVNVYFQSFTAKTVVSRPRFQNVPQHLIGLWIFCSVNQIRMGGARRSRCSLSNSKMKESEIVVNIQLPDLQETQIVKKDGYDTV